MREPLFTPHNQAALRLVQDGNPESLRDAREAAALHRAISLAIESAFRYGIDLPVGAVAIDGDDIVGRGFAGDTRLGFSTLHAEAMALVDTSFDVMGGKPRTIVVSAEPCNNCQDTLARDKNVERVVFGLSREDMVSKGLVKPHSETIFERAARLGLPYEVAQAPDEQLRTVGLTLFDHVSRDPQSGEVSVDHEALSRALTELNQR